MPGRGISLGRPWRPPRGCRGSSSPKRPPFTPVNLTTRTYTANAPSCHGPHPDLDLRPDPPCASRYPPPDGCLVYKPGLKDPGSKVPETAPSGTIASPRLWRPTATAVRCTILSRTGSRSMIAVARVCARKARSAILTVMNEGFLGRAVAPGRRSGRPIIRLTADRRYFDMRHRSEPHNTKSPKVDDAIETWALPTPSPTDLRWP